MRVKYLHPWNLGRAAAVNEQLLLAGKVIVGDEFTALRTVCGVDVSYKRERYAAAACVVMSYPGLEQVEMVCTHKKLMI